MLGVLLATGAHAASVKLSTGYFYANGQSQDINTPDSTIEAFPLGLKVKEGRVGFKVSTSYLRLKSGTAPEQSGMGDTTVSLSYELTENPWWTLTVKEKFATGDEQKGLSTGYNDTKVQLDFFRTLGQGRSLFATAGYTFKGGKSEVPTYQDAVYGSVGLGSVLGSGVTGGISLDYTQATSTTLEDTLGGTVFLGYKLSGQFGLNLFAGYDSSNTTSAGLGLGYKFK